MSDANAEMEAVEAEKTADIERFQKSQNSIAAKVGETENAQ